MFNTPSTYVVYYRLAIGLNVCVYLCAEKDKEMPLPFDVALPQECTVSATNADTYNQGLCSRRPCKTRDGECALSSQCCFEVGDTVNVEFTCSNNSQSPPQQGHVIVTCTCQPCSQLHAEVSGKVTSSLQNKPVVLAAVLVGNEVVTFTDQNGAFSFETLTLTNELTMIFQETNHREVRKTVPIRPSLVHRLRVVMEYIEVMDHQHKTESGFDTALVSEETSETYGVNGFLHFPPNAFMYPGTDDPYHGSGNVLHSLYCTDKWPSFSMPALDNMVYVDSRGAEFSIQSLVIGSLAVAGEGGEYLELQPGAPLVVTTSIRIDSNVNSGRFKWLHLFSYSREKSRWQDHGKMSIIGDTSLETKGPLLLGDPPGKIKTARPPVDSGLPPTIILLGEGTGI